MKRLLILFLACGLMDLRAATTNQMGGFPVVTSLSSTSHVVSIGTDGDPALISSSNLLNSLTNQPHFVLLPIAYSQAASNTAVATATNVAVAYADAVSLALNNSLRAGGAYTNISLWSGLNLFGEAALFAPHSDGGVDGWKMSYTLGGATNTTLSSTNGVVNFALTPLISGSAIARVHDLTNALTPATNDAFAYARSAPTKLNTTNGTFYGYLGIGAGGWIIPNGSGFKIYDNEGGDSNLLVSAEGTWDFQVVPSYLGTNIPNMVELQQATNAAYAYARSTTNGLLVSTQPPSANLTNWSALSTNAMASTNQLANATNNAYAYALELSTNAVFQSTNAAAALASNYVDTVTTDKALRALAIDDKANGLGIPPGAIIYETFNRPNGPLSSSITTESGHPLFFSIADTYSLGATNMVIEDGVLRFTGTNYHGGYNTYMWFSVPFGHRFVTGIRYRGRLWNPTVTSAYAAGITFTCGQNQKDASFWTGGHALHNQFVNGLLGSYWSVQYFTNGVLGGPTYFMDSKPHESAAGFTNEWRVLEWGMSGANSIWMSASGYRTNLYSGDFANGTRTNCYWQIGGSAAKSISDGLYNEFEIDAFWVRQSDDAPSIDARSIAAKVSTTGTAGAYTCGPEEVFVAASGATNIYLPGGLNVRSSVDGSYAAPFQNKMLIVVANTGTADGTNIHIHPKRYTNYWWSSSSVATTNIFQDNINGSTSPYLITTNGTAVRLICAGTNWFTW